MNKFNILYESVVNKSKIEKAIEDLIESVNEFDNGGTTLPNIFKKHVIKNHLENVKQRSLTDEEQKQLQTAKNKVNQIKVDNLKPIDIPYEDIDKYYNDIDVTLSNVFGQWWKEHVFDREEKRKILQDFKKLHPNIAMPVKSF